MVKWKIREVGQQNYVVLDVNPSQYSRSRDVDVAYEPLVDGSYCRIVSPSTYKKEDYPLVWASVNQTQLDKLMGFVNKKVEIVDHLLAISTVYVDGIERQYLLTGTVEQRYAVNIKLREV